MRVEQFIFIGQLERVLDVGLRHPFQRFTLLEVLPNAFGNPKQQRAKEFVPVFESPINRRSIRARHLGYGAHGERLLAAPLPQRLGSLQNPLFEFRVWWPRHASSLTRGSGNFIDTVDITFRVLPVQVGSSPYGQPL